MILPSIRHAIDEVVVISHMKSTKWFLIILGPLLIFREHVRAPARSARHRHRHFGQRKHLVSSKKLCPHTSAVTVRFFCMPKDHLSFLERRDNGREAAISPGQKILGILAAML